MAKNPNYSVQTLAKLTNSKVKTIEKIQKQGTLDRKLGRRKNKELRKKIRRAVKENPNMSVRDLADSLNTSRISTVKRV